MSTSTTDADRILGTGVQITLANNRTITLRYSMRGVAAVDRHFGSITAMFAAINGTLTTPVAEPLANALAAGMLHRNVEVAYTAEVLLDQDLLDTARLEPYTEAVVEAMMQAFPPIRRQIEELEKEQAQPAGSPGTTGSTPPSSSSDSTPATSPT